jgi:hypothetical protein
MKVTVFWEAMPYSMAEICQGFGEPAASIFSVEQHVAYTKTANN